MFGQVLFGIGLPLAIFLGYIAVFVFSQGRKSFKSGEYIVPTMALGAAVLLLINTIQEMNGYTGILR